MYQIKPVMNVQELIIKLSEVPDKSATIYMRIGGLPLVNVDDFELDVYGDLILFEGNDL